VEITLTGSQLVDYLKTLEQDISDGAFADTAFEPMSRRMYEAIAPRGRPDRKGRPADGGTRSRHRRRSRPRRARALAHRSLTHRMALPGPAPAHLPLLEQTCPRVRHRRALAVSGLSRRSRHAPSHLIRRHLLRAGHHPDQGRARDGEPQHQLPARAPGGHGPRALPQGL
jgi:hypothetical protein